MSEKSKKRRAFLGSACQYRATLFGAFILYTNSRGRKGMFLLKVCPRVVWATDLTTVAAAVPEDVCYVHTPERDLQRLADGLMQSSSRLGLASILGS